MKTQEDPVRLSVMGKIEEKERASKKTSGPPRQRVMRSLLQEVSGSKLKMYSDLWGFFHNQS